MLPEWYSKYKEKIEENIKFFLDDYFYDEQNQVLRDFSETIYYSIKGGKKIRSILALEFYLNLSGKNFEELDNNDDIWKICFAIECLHGYSLVHDDLPAMDNDLYRRGEKTTWNKFGETDAILAGDAMQSLSFEALAMMENKLVGFELIKIFANAVGVNGMAGGQVLDLFYENNPETVNLEKLIETHDKKTGALITFSVIAGVLLSGYSSDLSPFYNFGKKFGLAFQVKDDLLDVEGTFEETGKSVGGEKKGFVHLIGIEESKKHLENIIEECHNSIKKLNDEKLEFLVDYVGKRTK